MNDYYLTLVFKDSLEEKARQAFLDELLKKVLGGSGKVLKQEPWGEKELAYPIQHQAKGYFLHLQLETEPGNVKGLDKYFNTQDDILRYLLVRV